MKEDNTEDRKVLYFVCMFI